LGVFSTVVVDQFVDEPVNVMTLALPSTATQNFDEAHETSVRCLPASMLTGSVHVVPVRIMASPLLSTTTQNVLETHEIAVGFPEVSSAILDHVPLFDDDKMSLLPSTA